MKIAFVTMVWRDYWLLKKWISHNEQWVPRRQLYVINHGGDPKIDEIAEGCSIIHAPRDELTPRLDRQRWDLLGAVTNGLLAFYDRVVCSDVDEFLLYLGKEGDLLSHLEAAGTEGNAIAPIGLNIMPSNNFDPDQPLLVQHPNAMVHPKYTKPCIAHSRVVYTVGGHGLQRGDYVIDAKIGLAHLHYVTPDYQKRMSDRQDIVAQSRAHAERQGDADKIPKRFWINWKEPDLIRQKDQRNFERGTIVDVSGGFDDCANALRAAKVSKGKQTVVEPELFNKSPLRIVLPERLQQTFQ
ncbi:hypothetical protein [Thalassovita mediterranea]|jgi:hypothetical protein|uniref:Glycosyl transferase family 2 n=1 Tax=Thalassovita mediterranea TaxID=340021 RepID=A0A0P1GM57_9RHOB|nr:hypothetical protein [Thalassovita mediterranea]CUH83244.1 hypothetical protein TM5383_00429 [Thalassovita mediterranea]SIS33598.1 hypothetical protein SAMN05421685_108158 [Thalassovita mediterranea]